MFETFRQNKQKDKLITLSPSGIGLNGCLCFHSLLTNNLPNQVSRITITEGTIQYNTFPVWCRSPKGEKTRNEKKAKKWQRSDYCFRIKYFEWEERFFYLFSPTNGNTSGIIQRKEASYSQRTVERLSNGSMNWNKLSVCVYMLLNVLVFLFFVSYLFLCS